MTPFFPDLIIFVINSQVGFRTHLAQSWAHGTHQSTPRRAPNDPEALKEAAKAAGLEGDAVQLSCTVWREVEKPQGARKNRLIG